MKVGLGGGRAGGLGGVGVGQRDGELGARGDDEGVAGGGPAVGFVGVVAPEELGLRGVGEVPHADATLAERARDVSAVGDALVEVAAARADEDGVPGGLLGSFLL